MITKDGRDASIAELTPANYIVPAGEELQYHAVIEVVQFDPKTGKRLSRPRVQKFGRKAFERSVRDNLIKQGYTITVLHNPNDYLKAQAAKAEAEAKATAEAKVAAEKKAFDKAVQEAVDKALAEKEGKDTEKKAKTDKKAGK